MSFDIFNIKAHILMAAQADAKMKERPAPELIGVLNKRFGDVQPAKGHYKDPAKMALGHNKSGGPRRR